MKRLIPLLIITAVFLAGFAVITYPFISDWINDSRQSRVVAAYHKKVETMSENDFSGLLEKAEAYNERLRGNKGRLVLTEEDRKEYESLLDFATGGVMGTIEIPQINVNLPIYHGTAEAVLQVGAGHMEGTSLPIGGKGTHTVITGHRGLPSSTLLTNLDRLKTGDVFSLKVLNRTLYYQVDQILIVEPEDVSALGIDPNMDYCTLITCTPYGINTHRMLVRGHRVEGTGEELGDTFSVTNEGIKMDVVPFMIIAVTIALVISIICITVKMIRQRKRRFR